MADDPWRTQTFRQSVVSKIEKAIQLAGTQSQRNSMEMESHIFQKAKTKEEYLGYVARLILHVRETRKQRRERSTRLRDGHRKAINLRKTKSDQAAIKLKAPKFDKEFSLLVPYLYDEEKLLSNVTCTEVLQIDSQLEESCFSENTSDITADLRSPRNEVPRRNLGKRQRSQIFNKEPSAAAVLKEYLETTAETENKNKNDPLTNFFLNMAETVKTFPLEEQVEVKESKQGNEINGRDGLNVPGMPDPSNDLQNFAMMSMNGPSVPIVGPAQMLPTSR